jgi:hypothetical protein
MHAQKDFDDLLAEGPHLHRISTLTYVKMNQRFHAHDVSLDSRDERIDALARMLSVQRILAFGMIAELGRLAGGKHGAVIPNVDAWNVHLMTGCTSRSADAVYAALVECGVVMPCEGGSRMRLVSLAEFRSYAAPRGKTSAAREHARGSMAETVAVSALPSEGDRAIA